MAIIAICGLPGAGKTLFAVRTAWRLRRRRPERRIVANFPIYLPGRRVEVAETIADCLGLEQCDLILDEMHLWLWSREWKQIGVELAAWVSQLRKRDVNLIYTTQDLASVDKLVRERTFISYWLTSYRRLGFFIVRGYFGVKQDPRHRYLTYIYPFTAKIAGLYDTDYIVGV